MKENVRWMKTYDILYWKSNAFLLIMPKHDKMIVIKYINKTIAELQLVSLSRFSESTILEQKN